MGPQTLFVLQLQQNHIFKGEDLVPVDLLLIVTPVVGVLIVVCFVVRYFMSILVLCPF